MLVLSRKLNESVHIGDDIVVTVTRLGGNRVRLAIQAPHHVPVKRSELVAPRSGGGAAEDARALLTSDQASVA